MLPSNLALVEDDLEHAKVMADYLRGEGVDVKVFGDSNELLADSTPFDYDFYLLDLVLPGVSGVELIRILRRRTDVGVVVVSGRTGADTFDQVMAPGADIYLAKPVRPDQVVLAIKAVHRRCAAVRESAPPWRLEQSTRSLISPGGKRIRLSATDMSVMACFVAAKGANVSLKTLNLRLGGSEVVGASTAADNLLHASVYRLRKRIRLATSDTVPLQSEPGQGYVFRAALLLV